MKVLCCGGRDYWNTDKVNVTLDAIHKETPITIIIHGDATGADTCAENWAKSRFVRSWPFPVTKQEWKELGKSAGPIRNTKMLVKGKPDLVVAFPGERGTANMIKQAQDTGIEVRRII